MMVDGARIYLVPVWIPVLTVFIIVSLTGRARVWVRRSRADGFDRCESCGYNLTGNVSGVCPECGTPTGANTTATAQGKEDAPT